MKQNDAIYFSTTIKKKKENKRNKNCFMHMTGSSLVIS